MHPRKLFAIAAIFLATIAIGNDLRPVTKLEPVGQASIDLTAAQGVRAAAANAVIVREGEWKGSGVYLGDTYLATAWHVIKNGGSNPTGRVIFQDGTQANYRTIAADQIWDLAVLQIDNPHPTLPGVDFATSGPQRGEVVYSCGFGQGFRIFGGQVKGYAGDPNYGGSDWFYHANPAASGDSGGPMFAASGKLIGCLWGSDSGDTYGAVTQRFHRLTRPLFPRLAAWRQQRNSRQVVYSPGCGSGSCPSPSAPGNFSNCPGGQCPMPSQPGGYAPLPSQCPGGQCPMPSQPTPDPVPDGLALNTPTNTPVPGPKGERGAPGPPGKDGRDAEVTPEHLAAIAAIMKQDPGFIANLKGSDGADGINGKDGRDGLGVDKIYMKPNGDIMAAYSDQHENKIGNVYDLKPDDLTPAKPDVPTGVFFDIVPKE